MRPGRNLVLSVDLRIQYLAYRELKAAIRDQRAKSGSVIVLDVATGEVLAMVNQPAYNPNDRDQIKAKTYRNRASPTSSSRARRSSRSWSPPVSPRAFQRPQHHRHQPRYIKVGAKLLEDPHNLGAVASRPSRQELQRRHDQGGAVARARADVRHADRARLRPGDHQRLSGRVGRAAASLLALASGGHLVDVARLRPVDHAAAARARVRHRGRGGTSRPISFLRVETAPAGERALDPGVSRMLMHLLEAVVAPDGGGKQAAIPVTPSPARPAPHGRPPRVATPPTAISRCSAASRRPATRARGRGDHRRAGRRQVLRRRRGRARCSGVVGGALRLLAVPPDAPVATPASPRARWRRDEHCRRAVRRASPNCWTASPRCRATSR